MYKAECIMNIHIITVYINFRELGGILSLYKMICSKFYNTYISIIRLIELETISGSL